MQAEERLRLLPLRSYASRQVFQSGPQRQGDHRTKTQPVFPGESGLLHFLVITVSGGKARGQQSARGGNSETGSVLRGTALGDPLLWWEGASRSPVPAPNPCTQGAEPYGSKPASGARGLWASPWGPHPCCISLPGALRVRQGPEPVGDLQHRCWEAHREESPAGAEMISARWTANRTEETLHVDGVIQSLVDRIVSRQTG